MIGARLILEDRSYFEGERFGAAQAAAGEALSRKGMEELQIKDLRRGVFGALQVFSKRRGLSESTGSINLGSIERTASRSKE